MARDAVPIVALALNTGTQQGAGVAINVANGANIAGAGDFRRIILHVKNTFAGAKILTIRHGVYPPAFRNNPGDATFSILTSSEAFFELESARFIQADGSVNIDFEAAMTGTVFAYKQSRDI